MSGNNTNRRDSNDEEDSNNNSDTTTWIGLAAAGVAAIAGGIYWATRSNTDKQTQQTNQNQANQKSTNVPQANQKPSKVPQTNKNSNKVPQSNQNSNKVPQANQNSKKIPPANQKSTKVPQANQNSNKVPQSNQNSNKVPQANQNSNKVPQANQNSSKINNQTARTSTPGSSSTDTSSLASGVINFLSSLAMTSGSSNSYSDKIASNPPPSDPVITNLNGLLSDIYVRYVQIKKNDFYRHYSVFDEVFQYLHKTMKEVDPYYRKYSSMTQFAGSHYDNLRIKSADEFDMDIVIGLCLDLKENKTNPADSDINIQHQSPGYVQLKMGTQYQNLPWRDGAEWLINQTAYKWKDNANYLLRSKFIDWFKSVVNKALNTLPVQNNTPIMYIKGVPYNILKSESGPSMTLYIENRSKGFKLDVDLVPCLKFPEARWPINRAYRHIPRECVNEYWMVVGKPDKAAQERDQSRSWRIALHYQERELMHNCYNLKTTLRLIKCLRDALEMKKIASYYIKTIFFWEIVDRNDRNFWRKSPAYLFELMVKRLHTALVEQNIPYFWNKNNNLIKNVDTRILFNYAACLVPLIQLLEDQSGNNYKKVAKFLLTKPQFEDYNARFLHI